MRKQLPLHLCVETMIETTIDVASAELNKNPVEGFSAGLVDDSNVFEWQVMVVGPPDTL